MDKKQQRHRRAARTRAKIKRLRAHRLCIYKSNSNMYVQLISPCGAKVLCSASTLDKDLRSQIGNAGNKEAAAIIGKAVAERAIKAGIKRVAFDCSGFKYHGRVKSLADAARETGLDF